MRRLPRPYLLVSLVFGACLLACAQSAPDEVQDHRFTGAPDAGEGARAPSEERKRATRGGPGTGYGLGGGGRPMPSAAPKASPMPADAAMEPEDAFMADDMLGAGGQESSDAAPTRAWFPETFLFQPELVTGADGTAEVVTRVPDRLTTWRVLALAHDRAGHQAGDVTEFTSSLPLYADPVIPPKLRVGDRARLAIPVVNTTADARRVAVTVDAKGLDVRGGGGLLLPAFGSGVVRAELAATRPGIALVHADITEGGVKRDAVEHTIPVVPTGQRHSTVRTGTLGAPRTVALPLPSGADPTSAEIRLTIVPGGLGVVQSEVASAGLRTYGAQGAAVLLQLASVAPRLWTAAGLPVAPDGADPEARSRWEQARKLRLLAVQRAAQAQGVLPLHSAILLTAAGAPHTSDPLLEALVQRGLMSMEAHRHPDGTYGGSASKSGNWTVQRMLVATGAAVDAVRAVQESTEDDDLRRSVMPAIVLGTGAAERFASRVVDAYTASALLAAELVDGEARERMLELVRAAVKSDESGAWVELPDGVVRIDGQAPSRSETAALAARALAAAGSDTDAPLIADLGATVLSSFRPGSGWGDLNTDATCLRAVAELWSDVPSKPVTLTLTRRGEAVTSRTLAVDDLRDPVFMAVPASGDGPWTLSAEPAVPGLAYGLELVSYSPWTHPPRDPGLDVELRPPERLELGSTRSLKIDLAAPREASLQLDIELPTGVQVDAAGIVLLDGGEARDLLQSRAADGEVHLELPPVQSGRLQVVLPVSPTIAGSLWSGSVAVRESRSGALTVVPPTRWTITGG